jgi:SAM-dependent methyltransferase
MMAMDWVAHWRELVEGREAQADRVRSAAGIKTGGGYWDQRAAGFREGVQQRGGETAEVLGIISPLLTSSSTALDVGAGVGRYTIPLAQQVARVTAVEPSAGMRGYLEEDARATGLTNVTVVPATWEAARVEPCDIVLCSHVVYFITDIRAFLEKVRSNARGYVFMAIRTNQRDAALRELWEIVHKEARVPEPGLMDLYPTLRQVLGVTANVQVVTYGGGRNPLGRFDSIEDAMPEVRRQLLVAEGSPSEATALSYLRERMVQEEGKWGLPSATVANAVVWWDNRAGSRNVV